MVDFNSEGAFAANKGHILELVILGRRDTLHNAVELWWENKVANTSKASGLLYKVRGALVSLFLELEQALSRQMHKKDFEALEAFVLSSKESVDSEELMKYVRILNQSLDRLNMTKFDNKKQYDSRSVESENQEKGL